MSTKRSAARVFKISDDIMIQNSDVMLGLFNEEKERFSLFDKNFSDPFALNWKEIIIQARDLVPDSHFIKQVTSIKGEVKAVCNDCFNQINLMKFYIMKAFPDNRAMWNTFGIIKYSRVRQNPSLIVSMLDTLYLQLQNNIEKLKEVNCPETEIERINELKVLLEYNVVKFESAKNSRKLNTATNIEHLNGLWKLCKNVSSAAQIIFTGNLAKIKMFEMPKPNKNKKPKSDEQTEVTNTETCPAKEEEEYFLN